jgi:hypothetical protein
MHESVTPFREPGADAQIQQLNNIVLAINGQYENTIDLIAAVTALTAAIAAQATATHPIVLSGSTNGMPIKVVATATPGTLLHTAHATSIDQIWVYLTNTDSSSRLVTLEWGDATTPDHHIQQTVNPGESILAVPGALLTNSLTVRAFAAAANVITAWGYVLRRAP